MLCSAGSFFRDSVNLKAILGHLSCTDEAQCCAWGQVVACTPDSAGAADVFQASKEFKLPSHLLCKINRIELQVSSTMNSLGRCSVHFFLSWMTLRSRCLAELLCAILAMVTNSWVVVFLSYGLVIVQADPQTDEVFAQMDLTPQLEVCLAVVTPRFLL